MVSKTNKDNNIQLVIANAILKDCKMKIITVNIRKNNNLELILVRKRQEKENNSNFDLFIYK